MISHSHPHGHDRHKPPKAHPTELWRGLHKDWRTWAVVGLMLAAIGTYVLTLDDAVQPGGPSPNAGQTMVMPGSPAK
jgi:hypothetical protein